MSLQVEIEKKLNDKVLSVSFDTEGNGVLPESSARPGVARA